MSFVRLTRSFNSHSRILNTLQPRARSWLETRMSRRELTHTFCFQNCTFDFEAFAQRSQPCQKHPSTKSAISEHLNTKSGRPGKLHPSIFHPEIPRCTSRARSLFSVVRPFREVTSDIIRERALGVTRSINEILEIQASMSIIRIQNTI